MDQPKKPFRIRIESPPIQSPSLRPDKSESLPFFYRVLLFLTFAFSGVSLYLSFAAS